MLQKTSYFILLCGILFFIGNVQPAYASDGTKDVLVGYKDETGKTFIIEHSEEVKHSYQHISALSIQIKEENIPLLTEHPSLSYIKENQAVELSNNDQIREVALQQGMTETDYWNMDLIGARYAWLEGFTGKGVNIAIIDTGIAPHSELTISGGTSTVDYTDEWTDDHGHGTHVAGVIAGKRNDQGIAGVAPDANIYAVKALDQNGEGNLDDVLQAIDWSIANGMDIINLSLGMTESDPLLEEIINQAFQSGILVVGASGNKGESNSVLYPALYENVIAVSAVDAKLNLTAFSSTGAAVEYSAPGINIVSTFLNGSYGTANGTSQAAPHVVGMLALLKEKYPGKSSTELRSELRNYVQDLGATGRDPLYGHGFITYYPDDQTPPSEVTDFKINELTSDSISFEWNNPIDQDLEIMEMFIGDEFVANFSPEQATSYTMENLNANHEYSLTFYTIDHFGNRSEGKTELFTTLEANSEEKPDKEEETTEKVVNKDEAVTPQKPNSDVHHSPVQVVEKEPSNKIQPEKLEWTAEVIEPDKKAEEAPVLEEAEQNKEIVEEIEEDQKEELITTSDLLIDNEEVVEQEPTEDTSEKQEKGFFGKIIEAIINVFVSFFTWLGDLFR